MRYLLSIGNVSVTLALFLLVAWCCAALYFDMKPHGLGLLLLAVYVLVLFAGMRWMPTKTAALCVGAGTSALVVLWWFSLRPSNQRDWQPDVAEMPWAEFAGDTITIHNVRNCDYRAEFDYTPHWETRTYRLSEVQGLDLSLTNWGIPLIAHPIISIEFGSGNYLAFSIEVRKQKGESYSTIRGFFRQFELIYVIADERDVIRLRTNFRHGENVYLYHTKATPEVARRVLLDYLKSANQLREHPQWYNALTQNCTTGIRAHAIAATSSNMWPWNWRVLLNGELDEFLYSKGDLAGDLPFERLKRQAWINPTAKKVGNSPDFSRRVREGRAGFVAAAQAHSSR